MLTLCCAVLLQRDILAGLSVAALVTPQGLSYAKIAGLPPVYGLYGAFVPVMLYAALGSSRHLAVGPVAVTSLILGSGLPKTIPGVFINADPNNPTNPAAQQLYNEAAIQVRTGLFWGRLISFGLESYSKANLDSTQIKLKTTCTQ